MVVQFKRNVYQPVIALFTVLFFLSCQKDLDYQIPDPVNPPVVVPADLATKVTSSVAGFVIDENNSAVSGASVKVGVITTATDEYGFFQVKNVEVVKNAAMVTVEKTGYFKGIKTYIATAGKSAFFRVKLIPKTIVGTIAAAAGGEVTLTNGMKIALPSNAVVTGSGAAYSGTINVAASWIDPTSNELSQIMPGDLRGIATDESLKLLTTYGMAAVELTGATGELLQIASGKTSTLTMPVPASILGTAPTSIPLWSFNETNGLWKQEGSAVKTGNTYVGEVSHFSFWNCDVPNNYVQFDCTVVDANGQPVPFAFVKISVVGTPNNAGYGITDSSGFVSGAVPDNATLLLEIFGGYNCGNPVYSQNFTTTSANISLGTITINSSTSIATVTGSVTDCNGVPVTDGYIVMLQDNQYTRYSLSNTGTYSFTTLLCTSPSQVTFIAEDNVALQQSAPLVYTLSTGSNNVGNLQACGVTTNQFITYSMDGGVTNTTYSAPGDSLFHTGNGTTGYYYLGANNNAGGFINFAINIDAIGAGSVQNLMMFNATGPSTQYTVNPPTNVVNITEFGPVGGFIAGNFSASVTGGGPPVTYPVTCTFRVRRSF